MLNFLKILFIYLFFNPSMNNILIVYNLHFTHLNIVIMFNLMIMFVLIYQKMYQ